VDVSTTTGDGEVSIEEFVAALSALARDADDTDPSATAPHGQLVDPTAPGAQYVSGLAKPTAFRRRPHASGTHQRRPSEFVDDGYNLERRLGGDPDDDDDDDDDHHHAVGAVFRRVHARAKAMAAKAGFAAGAEADLLRRACERERSSPHARHLTHDQLRTALAKFDVVDDDVVGVVWRKCHCGDYAVLVDLVVEAGRGRDAAPDEEAAKTQHQTRLTRPQRSIRRLKGVLLDKIDDRGDERTSSFRLRVKRLLGKYDVDGSGELERNEIERAVAELLPGVAKADIDALIDEFDADGNAALSVDEIATALLAEKRARGPTDTSLKLGKKLPLYTKAGARGLT